MSTMRVLSSCLLGCLASLVLCARGASSQMENGFCYEVSNGQARILSVPSQSVVQLPETLGGHPVAGLSESIQFPQMLSDMTVTESHPAFTRIGNALYSKDGKTLLRYFDCVECEEFIIPNGVVTIGASAFSHAFFLKRVIFPKTVEVIQDLAFCQSGLETCLLPPRLSSIGDLAFAGTAITSIDIPQGISEIRPGTFGDCKRLQTFSTSASLSRIGESAFRGCSSLSRVYLPKSVSVIGAQAFAYCSALTAFSIPASTHTIEAGALAFCTKLSEITVSEDNNHFQIINGMLYDKKDNAPTQLVACPTGKSFHLCTLDSRVSEIADYAFAGCKKIGSVDLPKQLRKIGAHAFDHGPALTSWTFPETLEQIGISAFAGNDFCRIIVLPKAIRSLGNGAFAFCRNLHTFDASQTALRAFPPKLLMGTAALQKVVFPPSLHLIDFQAFTGATSLATITFPTSLTKIAASAFEDCTALFALAFPDSLQEIETAAFRNCRKLNTIHTPDNGIRIAPSAFENCPLH